MIVLALTMSAQPAAVADNSAEANVSTTLRTLHRPDLTLITGQLAKSESSEAAVYKLNEMLRVQYGLKSSDLIVKTELAASLHRSIARLVANRKVIAAYGLSLEASTLPFFKSEKVLQMDLEFLKTAISPPPDDLEFSALVEMANGAIKKIGTQPRIDWNAYLYWALMGSVFRDGVAVKAGMDGLRSTGAPAILITTTQNESARIIRTVSDLAKKGDAGA